MNTNTPTRSTVNADTPEAFAERERRKRVIDLARAIYVRHPHPDDLNDYGIGCLFSAANAFDAAAEKYRKEGAL